MKVINISISNHMFGRAIWDKLSECIFGNFEISLVLLGQNFQKSRGSFIPKIARIAYLVTYLVTYLDLVSGRHHSGLFIVNFK